MIGRRSVPPEVKALAVDERRLAWGLSDDGVPLVATASALWAGDARLGWAFVEKVAWVPPVLTVHEVSEIEGTGGSRSWTLASDARLAETVRACVTSSIAWSDRRSLGGSVHVRLIGRRVPGREQLIWQTVWERPTDRADPQLSAIAQRWVEELARTIG